MRFLSQCFRWTAFISLCALLQNNCLAGDAVPMKKGLALLLGVSTYQPGAFPDLTNPCRDIDFIGDILSAIPEIDVMDKRCNLSAPDIRTLVGKLHDELGNRPEGTFGLIYFSGHGVELADDVYLFGKLAKPNAQEVTARLENRRRVSGGQTPPFTRNDAVALLRDISPGDTAGNPVVIVVDACRSTPFGQEITGATPGSNLFRVRPTTDTLIAFSAAHGSQALDSVTGLDVSPYAKALGDAILSSDSSLPDMFAQMRRNLRGILSNDLSGRRQAPAELNALESRVCLKGCDSITCQACTRKDYRSQSPGEFVKTLSFSVMDRRRSNPLKATYTARAEKVGNPISPQSQQSSSLTVWDIDTYPDLADKLRNKQLGSMRLDIFWCDSRWHQQSLERATSAASVLAAFAQAGNTVDGTMLSKIRLRRLSPEKNAEPGYQISSDVVRYYPENRNEMTWAKALREQLLVTLGQILPSPVATSTPGYMSIFFCSPDDMVQRALPTAGQPEIGEHMKSI